MLHVRCAEAIRRSGWEVRGRKAWRDSGRRDGGVLLRQRKLERTLHSLGRASMVATTLQARQSSMACVSRTAPGGVHTVYARHLAASPCS